MEITRTVTMKPVARGPELIEIDTVFVAMFCGVGVNVQPPGIAFEQTASHSRAVQRTGHISTPTSTRSLSLAGLHLRFNSA